MKLYLQLSHLHGQCPTYQPHLCRISDPDCQLRFIVICQCLCSREAGCQTPAGARACGGTALCHDSKTVTLLVGQLLFLADEALPFRRM